MSGLIKIWTAPGQFEFALLSDFQPAEDKAVIERQDYHRKDRYPDPPPKPKSYAGWRREHGAAIPWEKVCEGPTKGAVYQELMRLSYLLVREEVKWEFVILAAGEKPALDPGWSPKR